jgi:hypothetical protein
VNGNTEMESVISVIGRTYVRQETEYRCRDEFSILLLSCDILDSSFTISDSRLIMDPAMYFLSVPLGHPKK